MTPWVRIPLASAGTPSTSFKEQHRAVEGAAIALNAADDCEHAGVGRRRRDRLDSFAIEVDGRLIVEAECLASLWL